MELGWLFDALHGLHLRQDFMQPSGLIEQRDRPPSMAFGEHLGEFLADSFAAHPMDLRREVTLRTEGFWRDLKTEARGEADCPQHPQLVLLKTTPRVADRTH